MTSRLLAAALAGASVLSVSAVVAASASSATAATPATGSTVVTGDKNAKTFPAPTIYAHRGASGYRPEHTIAAYELAVAQGADYFEPDLVMTGDGVLVDRHEPEIGGTTDVADHPEFASRKATKVLDGVSTTGWFVEDFTLAELETLRAKERLPQIRQENTIYDGLWQVPTFEEDLALREQLSKKYGRTIGIIPEIKHSTYLHAHGLDPEAAIMRSITAHGLNRPKAPIWIQSFELTNMTTLRSRNGYRANEVFLATNGGAPYDLVAAGDPRTYADLLSAGSLKQLSSTINGIGPDKGLVIARNADGSLGAATGLVDRAHSAGLQVVPWTFRAENTFLPTDYWNGTNPADYGRSIAEDKAFMRAGVDGLFCDQPDICIEARKEFWAGT